MNQFLKTLAMGLLKFTLAFVLVAIGARWIPTLDWFFFQRNEHYVEYRTVLATETALSNGDSVDVLLVGSSALIYSIDPTSLATNTGMHVLKFATGGQTIGQSLAIAEFLAPRLNAKWVVLDGYPRLGEQNAIEGAERLLLNTPQAGSSLARMIRGTSLWDPNTDILWLARLIGTAVKPYDISDTMLQPGMFFGVGYAEKHDSPPSPADSFYQTIIPAEVVNDINNCAQRLQRQGCHLVTILPSIQNSQVVPMDSLLCPVIQASATPDTCFWDAIHFRKPCVEAYTIHVAQQLNAIVKKSLPRP